MKSKISLKVKLKGIIQNSKIIKFLINIDIDWFFIFFITFCIPNWEVWQRLLFSIGISYMYKVVEKSIKNIKVIK